MASFASRAKEAARLEALAEIDERDLATELSARGWVVHRDDPKADRHVEIDAPKRGTVRIAIASDTHFGSKYQQVTHLAAFGEIASAFKPHLCLHGGDAVDGIYKMHRGMEYEQWAIGMDAQARAAVRYWPEIKSGKKTIAWHAIGGNHDGSFFNESGANIFERISYERGDIEFLGAPAARFHVSGLSIDLLHPDGGVPYARSYKPQKIVEQLAPGEKPHVWLAGHWHVPSHIPSYRGVETISLPCFQSQTGYLRRKGLAPVIGGLLLEIEYSERGLEDITTKWVLFHTAVEKDWPS